MTHDTIIVFPASPEQARCMKGILMDYVTLIPINIQPSVAPELVGIFGCGMGNMPFTYLGLPMGTTKPSATDLLITVLVSTLA